MRKKPETKNLKKNKFDIKFVYIILIVLIILIFGYLYFFYFSDDSVEENNYEFYRGFEFIKSNIHEDLWVTTVRFGNVERKLEFWHHPLDLENISYEEDINQQLYTSQISGDKLFISWSEDILMNESPDLGLLGYDLGRYMRSFFGFNTIISVENSEEYSWFPCEDANVTNFVIEIRKGVPRIESKPFCAILYVNDSVRATQVSSTLLYHLFGIME